MQKIKYSRVLCNIYSHLINSLTFLKKLNMSLSKTLVKNILIAIRKIFKWSQEMFSLVWCKDYEVDQINTFC